jgi:hypothetical protein
LVGILLRTPLRFALTGPNRSDHRHDLRPDGGGLAPVSLNADELLDPLVSLAGTGRL